MKRRETGCRNSFLSRSCRKDFQYAHNPGIHTGAGPPVGWPVRYRVSGPDNTRVRELATQLAGMIARNPDTRGVNLTSGEPERVIRLRVDQTQARATGMTSQSLAGTRRCFSGTTVTTCATVTARLMWCCGEMKPHDKTRRCLNALMLTSSTGIKVPRTGRAAPEWTLDDPVIWRRQRLPFITVPVRIPRPGVVRDRVVGTLSGGLPVSGRVSRRVTVWRKVEWLWNRRKGNSSVYAVLPVTLMVMLLLLMIQLQRFSSMLLAC